MKVQECVELKKKRPLIAVSEDEHIQSVYEKMESESVHHIAVLKDKNFLGLVDHDSILKAVMLSPQNFNSLVARDIMKGGLPVLGGGSTLEDVLAGFETHKIKALPYKGDDEELSVVTQTDMLKALGLILTGHQSKLESAEAKGELFMANPVVQRIMRTLSDIGI